MTPLLDRTPMQEGAIVGAIRARRRPQRPQCKAPGPRCGSWPAVRKSASARREQHPSRRRPYNPPRRRRVGGRIGRPVGIAGAAHESAAQGGERERARHAHTDGCEISRIRRRLRAYVRARATFGQFYRSLAGSASGDRPIFCSIPAVIIRSLDADCAGWQRPTPLPTGDKERLRHGKRACSSSALGLRGPTPVNGAGVCTKSSSRDRQVSRFSTAET